MYQLELPRTFTGRRRILRRRPPNGPNTRDAALIELNKARDLLALAAGDPVLADEIAEALMACRRGRPLPDRQALSRLVRSGVPGAATNTVGEYLTWWVEHRQIDEHTRIGYASHVRVHLVPHLGHIPLQRLAPTHVDAMFAAITERNRHILAERESTDPQVRESVRNQRLTTPATMTRVRATLRKALNDAVAKYRLIDFNPALHVEMPAYDRPGVCVWNPAAVAIWQATGVKPSPVMVWMPEQTGRFLDHTEHHDRPLHALYELVVLGGPRLGEAVGVRSDEVDVQHREVTFTHQITTHGYRPVYKKVKTRSGARVISVDAGTAGDLGAYLRLRHDWEEAAGRAGRAWPRTVAVDTPVPGGYAKTSVDLFFRKPNGKPWHPSEVTQRFRRATEAAGLPPIRFHDLRHAAATYLKAAGADLLDVKKKLGHASITVTADTYPAILEEIDRQLAERTAGLIPRRLRHRPESKQIPAPTRSTDFDGGTPPRTKSTTDLPTTYGRGMPDTFPSGPIRRSSSRDGPALDEDRNQPKPQVKPLVDSAPPAVFLAPEARPSADLVGDTWPPAERRTNRYPRDLK